MLLELMVENYAVIEKVRVRFHQIGVEIGQRLKHRLTSFFGYSILRVDDPDTQSGGRSLIQYIYDYSNICYRWIVIMRGVTRVAGCILQQIVEDTLQLHIIHPYEWQIWLKVRSDVTIS